MRLSQIIKDEALRIGFDLVGITTPDPPPHWPQFRHWLAEGRHASMRYLEDPRRADPRLVLPECRSIVVVALRYPNPNSLPPPESTLHGRIASYAWGRDYHLVLTEKLAALAAFIERQVGPIPHRWYTDTGPLLERELAQRAGLGWIGKNTCLIHPRLGSYFFLGELLLGLELEPDVPFPYDYCGTCTRCIQACPTGCILPDRTLDARRCISYLTIENKGDIPPALRPLLGQWVFGCDICQIVCPWNRRSLPPPVPEFAPRPGIPTPDLLEAALLTPEAFNRIFRDSAVQRARRRGYLRNVLVALGNSRNPKARPVLEQFACEQDELLAQHARWALEQMV
ncbi:MAG: tRNA epoxyqueuosine(34) reductase QueG [Anaerolineales bacterium]|nr:tRNA epoxyqueuosine(34) reductase QueG [Anaerolineales bacterium]MCX7608899.1 tRNA epoxyqueuosine(34) reductase QueG [Anaerolineales bacterium]MDW8227628.1 tRNA epoxyqueuosine(34) reductase QueG [Anaerolineales bacterium]